MKILLTGASGLIGAAIQRVLEERGHRVIPLLRRRALADSAFWNPEGNEVDLQNAGSFDAVIHLAGESIAQRWDAAAKARIRSSRVDGTRLLVEALLRLPRLPRVFLIASAVGYYGDGGEEWFTEASPPGSGFLADVCRDWEAATNSLRDTTRVVQMRFGIVLGGQGGALAKMLSIFRFGLGGTLAGGRAWWSWIALPDLTQAISFALEVETLHGPVNMVTPEPVRNATFTRALGKALKRPTVLPVPRLALELALGEMARETMLASCRVRPVRLQESGFEFRFPAIEPALNELLGGVSSVPRS